MSSDWDYSEMAKVASEHGGPQQYLVWLKLGAREEGRAEGGIKGAAIGSLATVVVIYFASNGYRYFKGLRAKKDLAAMAEKNLLEGMMELSESNEIDSEDD